MKARNVIIISHDDNYCLSGTFENEKNRIGRATDWAMVSIFLSLSCRLARTVSPTVMTYLYCMRRRSILIYFSIITI